jgi:glycyl-tRNA synthetase
MEHSGVDLRAFRRYSAPVKRKVRKIVPNMKTLGPMFRNRAAEVAAALERADPSSVDPSGRIAVKVENELIVVPPEGFTVEEMEEEVTGERIVPHVIEPSFGIDRILYALMEHAYYTRPDSGYRVLRFRPSIAPIKAAVLPLMAKDGLDNVAMEIHTLLRNAGIRCYYDDSGSIGRRYARADEIGVPFAVTVDYQTLEDGTVTVRERDSTEQVRVRKEELPAILKGLVEETLCFGDVKGV